MHKIKFEEAFFLSGHHAIFMFGYRPCDETSNFSSLFFCCITLVNFQFGSIDIHRYNEFNLIILSKEI